MKVLLIQEVPGLGAPGDTVEVKDGYARNYLLPRKIAVRPTPNVLSRYVDLRAKYEAELADRRTAAEAVREKLAGMEIVFARRTHDKNKLYAAVRPQDVAKAIEERLGERIDHRRIDMEPLEAVGDHEVQIQIYEDITATVKIRITAAD